MSTASVRVLIVEDHDAYREFISSLVKSAYQFQVISEAADGAEAVQIAEELRPDLILLDIGLPRLNGIEAARRILQQAPHARILFVSQESSADIVAAAFDTGALGYLAKADAAFELIAAVNSVLLGKTFISTSVARCCAHPANLLAH